MEKIKKLFLRKCNAILVALLGVFGFSGCENIRYEKAMYGTPTATFVLKGAVKDVTNKQPIEGIQVQVVNAFVCSVGREHIAYLTTPKLTDENGRFELRTGNLNFVFPDISSVAIHFSDIDGEENGLFEDKVRKLSVEDMEGFVQTKPPSGSWNQGKFTKDFGSIKLTPKAEDYEEKNEETN